MKLLIVLLGPTGVGKTELCLSLAEKLNCPILNCDSRQLFKGLEIGTAAPTIEQQQRVKHYFVGTLGIDDYYSAAQYESDVMQLIDELYKHHDVLILSGGSMLYIDAICKGIDDIPTVDDETRALLKNKLEQQGLEALLDELRLLDPEHYAVVDHHNTRRIVHALEICYMTGKTYTSFRKNEQRQRPFAILKIGLQRPREELFERINLRVEEMMNDGLLEEALRWYPSRDKNALNTVGYKEIFEYLDHKDLPDEEKRQLHIKGKLTTLHDAKERIKKNTRVYAKKQMTWFAHDNNIHWYHPDDQEGIMQLINTTIENEANLA